MVELPGKLCLTPALLAQMQSEVERLAPEEACGLLAGLIEAGSYQALAVLPLSNSLHSPVRFRIDASEQLAAFQQIEAQGWELVGIYHSHPQGPEVPSATDIAEAYYPEAAYLVWSGAGGKWACRAFTILDRQVRSLVMSID
ncbi:MAG: M67 family metallopeptidase [Chloroflexota bacterium]